MRNVRRSYQTMPAILTYRFLIFYTADIYFRPDRNLTNRPGAAAVRSGEPHGQSITYLLKQ
jgi:hypothetical protein